MFFTASYFISITSHIHSWVLFFALAPCLHSFWSYFSTLLSSILGTYRHEEFILQCHIFLPFHTVYGVLKARIVKWFAISSSSGPCVVRTLHHGLSWVALCSMAHSFIELDKAVVYEISLISFLWLVFILSALWGIRIRGLWKLPFGRDLLCGKLGLVLMDWGHAQ